MRLVHVVPGTLIDLGRRLVIIVVYSRVNLTKRGVVIIFGFDAGNEDTHLPRQLFVDAPRSLSRVGGFMVLFGISELQLPRSF